MNGSLNIGTSLLRIISLQKLYINIEHRQNSISRYLSIKQTPFTFLKDISQMREYILETNLFQIPIAFVLN